LDDAGERVSLAAGDKKQAQPSIVLSVINTIVLTRNTIPMPIIKPPPPRGADVTSQPICDFFLAMQDSSNTL